MKGLITGTQKRQYKSSEPETTKLNITDSTGIRSPKSSPRRTPKKRKSRSSFKIPTCKRILDLPSSVDIPDLDNKTNVTNSGVDREEIEVLAVKNSAEPLFATSSVSEEVKVCQEEIVVVKIVTTGVKPDEKLDPDENESPRNDSTKEDSVKKCSVEENSVEKETVEKDTVEENSVKLEEKSVKLEESSVKLEEKSVKIEENSVEAKEKSVQDDSNKEDKKTEDVDEGYFDSSSVDLEKILETLRVDASTETAPQVQTNAATITEEQDLVDILNRDFQTKLRLTAGVQTELEQVESEPKRRKVNKACQITDEAIGSLNRKLLSLRNQLNKAIVEKESVVAKNSKLKEKCSHLDTERLSLLAQTEALQNECVKKMHDNDKLTEKVQQRECHVSTLKESLVLRDKELHLLHRQPNSTAGIAKQINEYRELEMLRVDNIRLLHDNRALTASLDSLNGQLCALRRIGRNYEECKDNVILMNKRLAEDNSVLSSNLSSVRKELKSITQEHQDTLEEVRYLRLSAKRSADQRDQPDKEELSTDAAESNRLLRKQNSELKHSVEILRGEVATLHTELTNARSAHIAFDQVLQEKCDLHHQLQDVEARNAELWTRVEKLQQRCVEQSDASAKQTHDRNILSGENTELRKTNDMLNEKVVCLQRSLEGEIQKNADMAKQIEDMTKSLSDANVSIQDLQSTMEFLQVEHSFIEADVEKKNESIHDLNAKIEELSKTKEDVIAKCKSKLKERTKKLNASRIKLGYALMEMRELNSQGSSSSE